MSLELLAEHGACGQGLRFTVFGLDISSRMWVTRDPWILGCWLRAYPGFLAMLAAGRSPDHVVA